MRFHGRTQVQNEDETIFVLLILYKHAPTLASLANAPPHRSLRSPLPPRNLQKFAKYCNTISATLDVAFEVAVLDPTFEAI